MTCIVAFFFLVCLVLVLLCYGFLECDLFVCFRNRKEFYLSQTEDCGAEAQISLRNCSVLCLVRTKNIKQVTDTSLQGLNKNENKTDQHVHSKSVWAWHLGRQSYH